MTPLCGVDVAGLVSWIGGIGFADWPQQRPIDGLLRPAMVTDPEWHGFKSKVDPLVSELMKWFPDCTEDTRMLSVVMPGHSIEEHVDLQAPNWVCRVHVPLLTNPLSTFVVSGKPYWLEVGTAYKVNTLEKHSVTNDGPLPRIHFMFDIRERTHA